MAKRYYSKKDENTVRRLRRRGKSSEQIAAAIGRTVQSVQNKIQQLKLPNPNTLTDELKETVRTLAASGLTHAEIAKTVHRSESSVSHVLRNLKVRSTRIYTVAQKRLIRKMVREGTTLPLLAEALGRTESGIRHQLDTMKLRLKSRFYTRAELKTIREMWTAKKTPEEIATSLDRPLPGLKRKLGKLGLYTRRYTKSEIRLIRKLKRQKLNAVQIAAQLPGRDVDSIRTQLRRMGLGQKRTKKQKASIAARKMTRAEHSEFTKFLRTCTLREHPIPVHETMLIWNSNADARGVPHVLVDKVEYWLKKLKLPVVTGKAVKASSPVAHRRRVKIKVQTLHAHLDQHDLEKREKLRTLRIELLSKNPEMDLVYCPRCDREEGPWPIHPEFFYYARANGEAIPRLDSCILCHKRRRRSIKAMKVSGAGGSAIADWRRCERAATLRRRRELGISQKCKRAMAL